MAAQYRAVKDPNANLDYGFDWSRWLETGDTVTASTWSANGAAGITLTGEAIIESGKKTRVFVAGGTTGQKVTLTNQITTNDGRVDERSIQMTVRER